MGWTFLDIDELPDPGDIVWCKFPVREKPGSPGPIVRPTLVRASRVHKDESTGVKFGAVQVSYGTGNFTEKQKIEDLIIEEWNDVRRCGLHKPTRFSLDPSNKKNLIWCSEYFVGQKYARSKGIYVGRLGLTEREQLRQKLIGRGLISS